MGKGRGRNAPRLPPLAVTEAELQWIVGEVARLTAQGFKVSVTQFMRNRIFDGMPGYKG